MKNPDSLEGCLTGSIAILTTLLLTTFIIVGCSAPRQVTQLVEHVQRDTIYLSNIQYDSIYITQEKEREYRKALPNLDPLTVDPGTSNLSPDTLYIRDVSIEYRYKLLRDTVRIVQRDSIPYEVVVYKGKSINHKLSTLNRLYDHLTRACVWICFSGLLVLLYKVIKYFRSGGILNH